MSTTQPKRQRKTKKATLKFRVNFAAFKTIERVEKKLNELMSEVQNHKRQLKKLKYEAWHTFRTNSKNIEVQL